MINHAKKIVAGLAMALIVAGCAAVEKVSQHVEDNPLIYQFAMQQVLYRTVGIDPDRIKTALGIVNKVQSIEDDPATLSELGDKIRDRIGYDEMALADRAIVDDLLAAAGAYIKPRIGDEGVLDEKGRAALMELLRRVESDLKAIQPKE